MCKNLHPRGTRVTNDYDFRIGQLIRKRRIELGLIQSELAQELGYAGTISSWELGYVSISEENLELVAAALDVPLTYFRSDAEALDREIASREAEYRELSALMARRNAQLLQLKKWRLAA